MSFSFTEGKKILQFPARERNVVFVTSQTEATTLHPVLQDNNMLQQTQYGLADSERFTAEKQIVNLKRGTQHVQCASALEHSQCFVRATIRH